MAQCAYCGADTMLYNSGVPICLVCVDRKAEPRRKEDKAIAKRGGNPVLPVQKRRKAVVFYFAQ
jgi:hypothetical protein